MNNMYAKYTSCLYNVLEDNPNLLDNLTMSTNERTKSFKDMFISKWFNYEIGLETIGLFKLYIENKFKSKLQYYEEMLDVYETKINYLDGITITKDISHTLKTIDNDTGTSSSSINGELKTLPRAYQYPTTPTASPSQTDKSESSSTISNNRVKDSEYSEIETKKGYIDITTLRIKYMNQIRNLYEEFVMEFKSCFIQLLN